MVCGLPVKATVKIGSSNDGRESVALSGMEMNIVSTALLLLMISCGVATAQSQQATSAPRRAYSNATLGFRYIPPSEMRDKTERFRAEIQERAEASHTKETLDALLAMSSGPDDAATDWHSLTIETYPRKAVADLDDASAEAKMSAWVAHSKDASALPRSVIALNGNCFPAVVTRR